MVKKSLQRIVRSVFGFDIVRKGSGWSLIEIEQLERFLRAFEIDCVFDVGANIGQYAECVFATGFRGTVVSFEPNPEAVAVLQKKAEKNPRWKVVPTVLDSCAGKVDFNIMSASQFSSLHSPDHSQTDIFLDRNVIIQTIQIEATTLDRQFEVLAREIGFNRPFLKMDTQGHDLAVVAGGRQHIAAFAGLQSELSINLLYEGAPNWHEALKIYRDLGFRLTALIPNNAGHFPNLNEIDCLMYNPAFLPAAVSTGQPGVT
jgi:FkbM family methyltransferase